MTDDVAKQPQISDYFEKNDFQNIQNLFTVYTGFPCLFISENHSLLTVPSGNTDFTDYCKKIADCKGNEFDFTISNYLNISNKECVFEFHSADSQVFYIIVEFDIKISNSGDFKFAISPVESIENAKNLLNYLLLPSNVSQHPYFPKPSFDSNIEPDSNNDSEIYEALFENNHSVMLLINPEDGRIFKANQAAANFYGWTTDEFCSKSIFEINVLSSADILEEMKLATIEKRKHFLFKHKLSNGEIRDVEVFSGPIYFQNKKLLYSIIQDITDRIKIQNELVESEKRWKYALEGSTDGVWDWDLQTNKVFYSTQWKAMLGYEEHEISDSLDEWSNRVHPDDLENTISEVQRHLEGQTEMYSNVHRVVCKNGNFKWILDEGKVVDRDSEGKPLRAIGAHKDITHQIQTEKALIQSQIKYGRLLENISDVVFEIDRAGIIIYISKPIEKYWVINPKN